MNAPKRPPVIICNFDFRASGTVAKSIEIAAALAKAELPVQLWSISGAGPLRGRVPANVTIKSLLPGHILPRRFAIRLATALLARSIAVEKPALFLSAGNHMHKSARRAARLSGRRDQMRFGLRASNSSTRPGKERPAKRKLAKYRGADFAVAVTPELVDDIKASGSNAETHIIPNGVDLARIDRLKLEAAPHAAIKAPGKIIVTMGRIAPQKGFDILVEAMAMLSDKSARLIIIGDGSSSETAALLKRIERLGLADRVTLAGFMANPFPTMAAADLFVSSSRWEGASNVLLEALACGLPIVATDCPTGNAEIVGHGDYGRLVPVEDAPALASAIDAELADPADGAHQRERAEHFALPQCLNKWVELLSAEYQRALTLS